MPKVGKISEMSEFNFFLVVLGFELRTLHFQAGTVLLGPALSPAFNF
jgi:hypothetical protein